MNAQRARHHADSFAPNLPASQLNDRGACDIGWGWRWSIVRHAWSIVRHALARSSFNREQNSPRCHHVRGRSPCVNLPRIESHLRIGSSRSRGGKDARCAAIPRPTPAPAPGHDRVQVRLRRGRASSLRSVIKRGGVVVASSVPEHALERVFEQVQHVRPREREALHLVGDPTCGRLDGGRGRRARAPGGCSSRRGAAGVLHRSASWCSMRTADRGGDAQGNHWYSTP